MTCGALSALTVGSRSTTPPAASFVRIQSVSNHLAQVLLHNAVHPQRIPGGLMYHHVKKLMYTVRVDAPDPRFGNMLLEQFGGANGELAAAMQYSIQGLNCEDPE